MSGPGELTWDEAMDRGRAALMDSERLYDDINASEGRQAIRHLHTVGAPLRSALAAADQA